MPELPEVETIVKDLRRRLVGKKIKRLDLRLQKFSNCSEAGLNNALRNKIITALKRKGKIIIIEFGKNYRLHIHLKMTGQLIWNKGGKVITGGHTFRGGLLNLPNKYTHAIYYFTDGSIVYHNDLRQFGWVKLFTAKESAQQIVDLRHGPEPAERGFTAEYLRQAARRHKNRPIKSLILDQTIIAGVGNIYADESLFCAKINPARKSGMLSRKQIVALRACIKKIIRNAIRHKGTTIRDYLNSDGNEGGYLKYLKVFNKNGKPCPRCRNEIKKTRIAGRGTHYCNRCQV
jgi:formamidopyrimidine-DNA glycosylase